MLGPLLALALAAPLELTVGAQQVVPGLRVKAATAEGPAVTTLRLVDDRLLLTGVQEGTVRVRVQRVDGVTQTLVVHVAPFDVAAKLRDLRARLAGVPAVVWLEGTCVQVECPDCDAQQAAKVEAVRVEEPCVRAVHVISPGDPDGCVARARELLGDGDGGTPDLELHRFDHRVVITGTTHGADDRARLALLRQVCPTVRLGVLDE